MKVDELKIFLATAEAGSFVGAAEHLGLAPSVVSRAIKNLEITLKTTLFSRTTRKVSLTGEGVWLLEQGQETLEKLNQIQAHFHDNNQELTGRLTIDAATPFALHLLAPILDRFVDQHPKLEISLESNEDVTDLIDKKVDIAIRIGALKSSSLKVRKIGETTRGLYASPAYLEKQGTPKKIADLLGHKCLGFTKPEHLNSWPLIDDQGNWFKARPHLRANSGESLKQLAVNGNGIICVSDFTVQKELDRGELVPLLEKQTLPHAIPISAVFYSEHKAVRQIRAFLDFVAEHAEF